MGFLSLEGNKDLNTTIKIRADTNLESEMFSILGSVPVINQMEAVKLRGRDQRYRPYHERSERWSNSLLEPPGLNTRMLPQRARDEGGGGPLAAFDSDSAEQGHCSCPGLDPTYVVDSQLHTC